LVPLDAQALPLFARQTGQNCLACHAGGQFPVLTPYGRKFKLTGYTIGSRSDVPLSVMLQAGVARVSNTTNGTLNDPNGGGGNGLSPNDTFPRNGLPTVTQASLFAGGRITDNIGLFGQWTLDPYAYQNGAGKWSSHSATDQFDLRYADRLIDGKRDLIFGFSLNNNVGNTDVWNTFNNPFQSVPTPIGPSSLQGNIFTGPPITPMINSGLQAAGVNAYAYWNDTVYAEVGLYRNANKIFSFMSQGTDNNGTSVLSGGNPYWRLALNHDWGPHSAMVGLHGMDGRMLSTPGDIGSPIIHNQDVGIDGQYQYNLDPHTVTAQFSYTHERQSYDGALLGVTATNSSNTLDYLKLNGTYIYQAKYGASLSYVTTKGSADSTLYTANAISGSANNSPNTKVWIPEVFWTPVQYMRIGLQYYKYTQFMGGNQGYDGVSSRSAGDNNLLFLYFWGAY
ncbi:MAG: cytochrome C, partial [Betaproteobacteria bacterium]|nr:cytochrome C [Betaproteobacteria bacterium]